MTEVPCLKTVANDVLLPQVDELLRAGYSVTLTVRGNSMNPFLVDRRDKVRLVSCPPDRPRVGDFVLAYEAALQRYVLHRMIGRAGNGDFILMGDGNLRDTERIIPGQVLGLVVAVERKGRFHSTDSLLWRTYSLVWRWALPLRRWLLAAWRRL